jgi:hypothetical protein
MSSSCADNNKWRRRRQIDSLQGRRVARGFIYRMKETTLGFESGRAGKECRKQPSYKMDGNGNAIGEYPI